MLIAMRRRCERERSLRFDYDEVYRTWSLWTDSSFCAALGAQSGRYQIGKYTPQWQYQVPSGSMDMPYLDMPKRILLDWPWNNYASPSRTLPFWCVGNEHGISVRSSNTKSLKELFFVAQRRRICHAQQTSEPPSFQFYPEQQGWPIHITSRTAPAKCKDF